MREKRYHLALDDNEHGIMLNALNEFRNDLIEEERTTDAVDDLIIKTAYAPEKRVKVVERIKERGSRKKKELKCWQFFSFPFR